MLDESGPPSRKEKTLSKQGLTFFKMKESAPPPGGAGRRQVARQRTDQRAWTSGRSERPCGKGAPPAAGRGDSAARGGGMPTRVRATRQRRPPPQLPAEAARQGGGMEQFSREILCWAPPQACDFFRGPPETGILR